MVFGYVVGLGASERYEEMGLEWGGVALGGLDDWSGQDFRRERRERPLIAHFLEREPYLGKDGMWLTCC